LSALIAILRLVGPVISTRLSRRSLGASATRQSDVRISSVASRKRGRSPAAIRSRRVRRAASSSSRRGAKL
jgi:hypothetical protein